MLTMNYNSVSSEVEFADKLQQLLPSAYENGVDVRGCWVVTDESSSEPEWEVQIVELARD